MRTFLLTSFLLGLIPSANAGIYIYPFFNKGIEVRCADNEPKHLISFKSGRVMKLADYGDAKYKFPKTYLFPQESNNDYSYFPSTVGTRCSYRKLTRKERKDYIKQAKDTCLGTTLPLEARLKMRNKYCYGWN